MSSRAMDFASLEGRCFSYLERWIGNLLPMEKAFLYFSSRLFCKLNWWSSFKPIANLGAIKVAFGVKASVSFASSLKSRCESLFALRMTFIFLMLFSSSVFLPLIANGSSKCAMVPLPPPMPSNPGQWQPFKVDWCSISSASLTNCYSLSSLASMSLIVFISRSAGLRLELLSALSSCVGDGDLAPLSCCPSSSCMISLPVRFRPISRPCRLSLAWSLCLEAASPSSSTCVPNLRCTGSSTTSCLVLLLMCYCSCLCCFGCLVISFICLTFIEKWGCPPA